MRDIVDMQSARCYIGGDEDIQFALLKPFQYLDPGSLVKVAADLSGVESVMVQFPLKLFAFNFSVGKNQDFFPGLLFHQTQEQVELFMLSNVIENLCDRIHHGFFRLNSYPDRIVHMLVAQLHNPVIEGR